MITIDDAVRPLAIWLLNHALHSTLLILLAWGIAARLRSAALRGLVWRVAIVGGLLTATVGGLAGNEWSRVELGSPVAVGSSTSSSAALLALEVVPGSLEGALDLSAAGTQGAGVAGDASPSLSSWLAHWPLAVVLLWLACATFGALRWRRARRELEQQASRREPLHDPRIRARLDEVLRRSNWRGPVRLSMCASLPSPIAMGANEICLPTEVSKLSEAALDALLAHECAHLARRDPRWLSIAHLVEGVFAYLPLHRLARRRLTVEAELASDAWAARTTGEPLQLARCLAEVAEWMGESPLPATVSAMARRGSELVRRVEVLVDGTPIDPAPRELRTFTGAALLALIAFACGAPTVGENGGQRALENEDRDAPTATITISDRVRTVAESAASVQVGRAGMVRVQSYTRPESEPFDLNTKDGLSALRAELSLVAADMPQETHGKITLPASELRIVVEAGARYHYVQKVMEQCGARDVQLWKIALEGAESLGEAFAVPLPVDGAVSEYLDAETFELTIRVGEKDGERRLTYESTVVPRGPTEEVEESTASPYSLTFSPGLEALEQRLKVAYTGNPKLSLTIDARKGTIYADVVAVLDIAIGIGFEQIVFVGSYE